ncbi:MAG: hypothetical protein AAF125_06045 [Chloroflexota bacterium]
MTRTLVYLCVLLSLAACQPQPLFPTPDDDPATLTTDNNNINPTTTVQVVNTRLAGTPVSVVTRADWDTLTANNGILLAQKEHAIDTADEIDGVLINIFKPDVERYDPPTETSDNPALTLMRYIVSRPDFVGDARVTTPDTFEWGNHSAAYYTLASDKDRRTLVIGVSVDGSTDVIVFNISVPPGETENLHERLIDGLRSITIDGVTLDGADLVALPNPISFPSTDVEIATDNTPQSP